MGASGVHWNNIPHEMILSQINGGAGAAPVIEAADSFGRIAATLREADQDLRNALTTSGASWEGQAADDMQTASTPLATWADEADQLAVKTSYATEIFGDQFAHTRGSVPAVVDVPAPCWIDNVGISALPGITTDREQAEADADAAQQEAARKMEAYDNASYDTVQTQFFSQPPTVTIEVPPPSASGGPSVGGTPTATPSGPTGAGTYVASGGWTAPGGTVTPAPAMPGVGGAGGGAIPSSPTAPAGTTPTRTIPSAVPGGGTYPGGGGPTGGGGVVPPTAGGGTLPGGGRSGSSRGGVGSEPLPGAAGMTGRGSGPGGYGGAGGLSAGAEHGAGGPGGRGVPRAGGLGGPGGLTGFGDEAHGQRGAAGPGGFGPAEAEAGARAGQAGRAGAAGSGAGAGPMGGGAQGEEDAEHKRPGYLVETEDVWGDGIRVAPPVIGERPT
jgi:PPE family